MAHTITISIPVDQWTNDSSTLMRRGKDAAAAWLGRVLSHPALRDINSGYGSALRYPLLDALAVKVIWIHGIVLVFLVLLNSYVALPSIFPSPLGWRVISLNESLGVLAIGVWALAVPLLTQHRILNHYVWRILVSLSLGVYSYLFIFISGGAVAMHFHMVLVMAFAAVYADWRLEWILFGFFALGSFIVDAFFPSWMYVYGHNVLSVPIHAVFILVMASLTSVLCQSHRQSVDDLVESQRRNDQFMAIAAHELRTPLTSMKGYVEVLERRLKRGAQPDLLSYTGKLDDQLSRVSGMVSDLLDISRIQSGQVVMRRERLSINSVVAQSVEEVQALAHHHKIVVSGWSNTAVMGDAVRLEQVLVNLLSNAMKYSPASDRVMVRVSEARDRVIISVQDFGIGISAKERAFVFEPYFRSQNVQREDVPGGLGMGLYFASEIVRRHGGKIWLDSEEGVGSTFSFLLPLPRERVDGVVVSAKEVAGA